MSGPLGQANNFISENKVTRPLNYLATWASAKFIVDRNTIAIAAIQEIKHKGEGIMNTGNFTILQPKYR
jgi:hypothetical protein